MHEFYYRSRQIDKRRCCLPDTVNAELWLLSTESWRKFKAYSKWMLVYFSSDQDSSNSSTDAQRIEKSITTRHILYPDLWQWWIDDVQSQKNVITLVCYTMCYLTLRNWPASLQTDLCKLHLALNLWPFASQTECIIPLVNSGQKQCRQSVQKRCYQWVEFNHSEFPPASSNRFRWISLASLDLKFIWLFVLLHTGWIPICILFIQ